MKPIRLTINGATWTIRFVRAIRHGGVDCDGICEPLKKQIRIRQQLHGQKLTDRIAHEIMHARLWDLDEESVAEAAEAIAEALYHPEVLRAR